MLQIDVWGCDAALLCPVLRNMQGLKCTCALVHGSIKLSINPPPCCPCVRSAAGTATGQDAVQQEPGQYQDLVQQQGQLDPIAAQDDGMPAGGMHPDDETAAAATLGAQIAPAAVDAAQEVTAALLPVALTPPMLDGSPAAIPPVPTSVAPVPIPVPDEQPAISPEITAPSEVTFVQPIEHNTEQLTPPFSFDIAPHDDPGAAQAQPDAPHTDSLQIDQSAVSATAGPGPADALPQPVEAASRT